MKSTDTPHAPSSQENTSNTTLETAERASALHKALRAAGDAPHLVVVYDLLRQARRGAHGHVGAELHLVLVQVQLHVGRQVLRVRR